MDPDAVGAGDRVPHGGEPDPSVLEFSANVNPRTPDGIEAVYAAALEESRRYPDDGYPAFREAAAAAVGCRPTQVIPTAGGLAAIRLALGATLRPGEEVLVPYPSFGEYAREVRLQGGRPRFVRHDELTALDPSRYALAIVCTPNNPTGEAIEAAALASFADRCREGGTRLLVDEAFLGYTALPSMAGRPGVVVARSLTKLYGLPGLRAGYAVATGELREALAVARPAWSLGTPAARVGAHCLADDEFVRDTRERVARERVWLRERLEPAFEIAPSDAPFLLCRPRRGTVDGLLERTRAAGIAIRDARTFRGLDAHVRIAVRDREDNEQLRAVMLDG